MDVKYFICITVLVLKLMIHRWNNYLTDVWPENFLFLPQFRFLSQLNMANVVYITEKRTC